MSKTKNECTFWTTEGTFESHGDLPTFGNPQLVDLFVSEPQNEPCVQLGMD